MSGTERDYLEAQNVEQTIADAIATVLKERPANALGRIAQLIAPAPMASTTLLDTVGNTPMVKLGRMLPEGCKATVLVKMEMQNPGGSIKDRIAKHMIEEAERSGALKPGMTVVEGTSGNTGIGVSMVCAAKGYKCIIVMPQVPPMLERYMVCRQFGAEVHLTAAALGAKGLIKHYEELVASDTSLYFGTNQFWNGANPEAHVKTTGPEVWAQTSGAVDVFIHGIGTGGTIKGAGSYLKSQKPECQVIAIEPSNARVHVGAPPAPHSIVGIGAGIVTHFLGLEEDGVSKALTTEAPIPGVIDEWAHASGEEAIEFAAKACQLEGMMVGPSAGAALKVACDVACRPGMEGKTVVAMLASHGIRYTAHPMWSATKNEALSALPTPPNMATDIDLVQWTSENYVKPE